MNGRMAQANGLLQAKVEMLRDNLKAARMDASEKARLQAEVARLKERRGGSSTAEHSSGLKTSRSTGEDDMGSQTQLWLQLVRAVWCLDPWEAGITCLGLALTWCCLCAGCAAEGELPACGCQSCTQHAGLACECTTLGSTSEVGTAGKGTEEQAGSPAGACMHVGRSCH